MSKGIVGYVATTGKTVNISHAQSDWRYDHEADR